MPTGRHYFLGKCLIVRMCACAQAWNAGSGLSEGIVGAVREPPIRRRARSWPTAKQARGSGGGRGWSSQRSTDLRCVRVRGFSVPMPFARHGRSQVQSFPRKRESTPPAIGNAPPTDWIPAFAGMTSVSKGIPFPMAPAPKYRKTLPSADSLCGNTSVRIRATGEIHWRS